MQFDEVQAGTVTNVSIPGVDLGCNTDESVSPTRQKRSDISISNGNDSEPGCAVFTLALCRCYYLQKVGILGQWIQKLKCLQKR